MSFDEPRVDRGGRAAQPLTQPSVPEPRPTEAERALADRVVARYTPFRRDQLLLLLHEIQAEGGWFSLELTRYLSRRLDMPFAEFYGVITFYALFKTAPTGRIVLRVCKGVPCYLRGAAALGEHLQDLLGVAPEEPTPDGRLSWEWFACLGQCDHAPTLLVGDEAVGDVRPERLARIVAEARDGLG
jgi:NADH:ubiquinone oxidoreductase subunit E